MILPDVPLPKYSIFASLRLLLFREITTNDLFYVSAPTVAFSAKLFFVGDTKWLGSHVAIYEPQYNGMYSIMVISHNIVIKASVLNNVVSIYS